MGIEVNIYHIDQKYMSHRRRQVEIA